MDSPDCSCDPGQVRDEAATWFVRQQDAPLSPEHQADFEQWCNQHPQHRYEFEVLQGLWSASAYVPRASLQALCLAPVKRRPRLRYAVAASVLAVALGLGLLSGINDSGRYEQTYTTALGERRHVALPDGSQVDLDSRSRLRVSFVHDQRRVELEQGEAMFSVEHDAQRPFVVAAGAGQITVTGTRFDVRRDPSQTRVLVASGTVKVQGRAGPAGPAEAFVSLGAGQGTEVDGQGQVAPARRVDVDQLTAWRSGKLVFNNTPLSEVVQEVSRYRQQPLTVASAAVGQLRLSSVFNSADTDALLKALPSILPVAVRTRADGVEEIISR